MMEVGGALAAAAFSLPCLVVLLVLGEVGLRVAALALRVGGGGGEGHASWPTRSAFLGYRIDRPAGSSSPYPVFRGDDEPPLPPECCDRLAVAVYRLPAGGGASSAAEAECAFCLSAVRDGDETRDLRCRHVFHRACIDAWLVRPRATCPLCRDRLLPDDPPRRNDDGSYFVVDDGDLPPLPSYDDDGMASASASASAASAYAHGGALWHMT